VVGLDSNLPDTPAEGDPDLVVASEMDAAVQPRNGSFFGHVGKLIFLTVIAFGARDQQPPEQGARWIDRITVWGSTSFTPAARAKPVSRLRGVRRHQRISHSRLRGPVSTRGRPVPRG
jgi:hypothetical protein